MTSTCTRQCLGVAVWLRGCPSLACALARNQRGKERTSGGGASVSVSINSLLEFPCCFKAEFSFFTILLITWQDGFYFYGVWCELVPYISSNCDFSGVITNHDTSHFIRFFALEVGVVVEYLEQVPRHRASFSASRKCANAFASWPCSGQSSIPDLLTLVHSFRSAKRFVGGQLQSRAWRLPGLKKQSLAPAEASDPIPRRWFHILYSVRARMRALAIQYSIYGFMYVYIVWDTRLRGCFQNPINSWFSVQL